MALRILNKEGMPKCTKHTITDVDQLFKEFEKIRALGFATDHEEAVEGACCISAPVRNHRGEVVAALSISMMAVRLGPSQEGSLIRMVRSTAARISAELGYEAMHHLPSRTIPQPEVAAQDGSRPIMPPHRHGTPPHISKQRQSLS